MELLSWGAHSVRAALLQNEVHMNECVSKQVLSRVALGRDAFRDLIDVGCPQAPLS